MFLAAMGVPQVITGSFLSLLAGAPLAHAIVRTCELRNQPEQEHPAEEWRCAG